MIKHILILILIITIITVNVTLAVSANFVFIHIPKTGGTTLKTVLMRHAKQQNLTVNPYPTYGTFTKYYFKSNLTLWNVTMGHYAVEVKKYLRGNYHYKAFLLLRNATEHIQSHYRYFFGKQQRINDFVDGLLQAKVYSQQCQWLQLPIDSTASNAKQHLMDEYDWISVLDMFDESLLLLQSQFQVKDISYYIRNVNRPLLRSNVTKHDANNNTSTINSSGDTMGDVLTAKSLETLSIINQCDDLLIKAGREIIRERLLSIYGKYDNIQDQLTRFRDSQPKNAKKCASVVRMRKKGCGDDIPPNADKYPEIDQFLPIQKRLLCQRQEQRRSRRKYINTTCNHISC